jgi:hypothetical protein
MKPDDLSPAEAAVLADLMRMVRAARREYDNAAKKLTAEDTADNLVEMLDRREAWQMLKRALGAAREEGSGA